MGLKGLVVETVECFALFSRLSASHHGAGREISFSFRNWRGNCKTRVSELSVINNPLAASDRTVIGLLNSLFPRRHKHTPTNADIKTIIQFVENLNSILN